MLPKDMGVADLRCIEIGKPGMTGMDCSEQINECTQMKVLGRDICEHGLECVNVLLGESTGDSGKIYKGIDEKGYNCVA